MVDLTLISFNGCPNAEKARVLLKSSGITFQDVIQDDLPIKHQYRGYTSPTILKGEDIVYGMTSIEAGCSIDVWNDKELYKLIAG